MSSMDKQTLIGTFDDGQSKFQILGYICWWSVYKVDVTREALIKLLEQNGIDAKYARTHNYRSAIIRSLHKLEENRIIRLVEETPNALVYQFTAENKLAQAAEDGTRLAYDPETVVTVDKNVYRKTDSLSKAMTGREDIKAKILNLFYENKDKYYSSDISRMVGRIFSDKADIISLRGQGSIYFVPSNFTALVQSVAGFMNGLGGSKFEFLPLPDVKNSRDVVKNAFGDEISACIEKLDKDLKKAQEEPEEMGDNWKTHRINQIEKLKQRVAMYSALLDGDAKKAIELNFERIREGIVGKRTLDLG